MKIHIILIYYFMVLVKCAQNSIKPSNVQVSTEVCFDLVGCFNNSQPFTNTNGILPEDPNKVATKLFLYTSDKSQIELSYLSSDSLVLSNYDTRYPLKIIVHGYQSSSKQPWVSRMADSIIEQETGMVNVVIINWEKGASRSYPNAMANARLVGKQIGLLVELIKDSFYDKQWSELNVHCIGHSLGAQICAYASNSCNNKFSRISGLDPAGPNFEDTDNAVHIDSTDAYFVDVIHTNGGLFGVLKPTGHVDFYPNGGYEQPGCEMVTLLELLINPNFDISCSHLRVLDLYIESINSNCSFLSYPCQIQVFNQGKISSTLCNNCNNGGCAIMGYKASPNSSGIKYLKTNNKSRYCQ